MKIDKNKLTLQELAFLESIEKRCAETETEPMDGEQAFIYTEVPVVKSVKAEENKTIPILPSTESLPEDTEDIYKGLNPLVKKELESLKKFREGVEDKELHNIAKKYAIIGKKEDELVPVLKNLKAAGGTAYNDMIAVLDQAVEVVEKSGAFSEIGKSGHDDSSENPAEIKIRNIAKSYMEKEPTLNYSAAVAKAWEDNPDLMDEYEKEAGF